MKNLNDRSIQMFGYFRILAIAIVFIFTVFGAIKAYAIAPHVPDIGLQAKVDYHRQTTDKHRNQKASEKVDKHKEHKEKKKAKRVEKAKKPKKEKGAKKQKKPKDKKPKKEKKPKKPSEDEKKRAAKHKMDNLA